MALALIRKNVSEQVYKTWFETIVFEQFDEQQKMVWLQVPSAYFCEYLEEHFIDLLGKVLRHCFGKGIGLSYRVLTDKEHNLSQSMEADPADASAEKMEREKAQQVPGMPAVAQPQPLDSQLDPRLTFSNYCKGTSNEMPYSMGLMIAEHPNNTNFNPMFLYGPSGCGKTHLVNAMGMKTRELYAGKRVLYISARLFQVQYTNANRQGKINEFIAFYQTIDMLIVDDVQEWTTPKTLETFFHIFNHLHRNGKRIILVSDRPPVELKDMPDRMINRFACGLVAPMGKPNKQLSIDILKNKIRRDGLKIPEDVVDFIAETVSTSVRDLQGVINSLMAYSIVYNSDINMALAERVIKRAVKIDDKPLTIDDILEQVCAHYNVTPTQVSSKSRKQDLVKARQVSMYLAQKYTKMPASRIGKLIGNRDHSTVLHSCAQVEKRMKVDAGFGDDVMSIETSFRLKA